MIQELKETYNKITNKSLTNNSQLMAFNLLKDSQNNKFFNIFRSFILKDLDITFYLIHESNGEERWDILSNKYYNTPYLWWTIPMFNQIENPFELPESGENINILKKEYIYTLLTEMIK